MSRDYLVAQYQVSHQPIIVELKIYLENDSYQNGQPAGRYTEEFVLELQQELVKARLREAEATVQLNEAHERIQQIEFENR